MRRFTPRRGREVLALALNEKGRERAPEFTPPLSQPVDAAGAVHAPVRHLHATQREHEPGAGDRALARDRRGGGERGSHRGGHRDQRRVRLELRGALLASSSGWTCSRARARGLGRGAGSTVTTVLLGDPMSWCAPHSWRSSSRHPRASGPRSVLPPAPARRPRAGARRRSTRRCASSTTRCELHIDTTVGGMGGCPYCGNGRATGHGGDRGRREHARGDGHRDRHRPRQAHRGGVAARGDHRAPDAGPDVQDRPAAARTPATSTTRTSRSWRPYEEARHFKLGAQVAEHQVRPWREPIPRPRGAGLA